jgi:VanZ family protein
LIFYFSSIPDTGGAKSELPELMFRKAAHLVEYGVLGLLLARALAGLGWAARRVWGMGLLVCVVFAVSDEAHQIFVPGRYGKARDVALDSLGAALALSMDASRRERRERSVP